MKNHLIIHGHFYQPPREDPWIGLIPYQESAKPHHDWNIRVTEECYAANSKSRALDGKGLIIDILNNYTNISFNFGPTLLNWIKDQLPDIYQAIIQADKISSQKNNHHGNAIAQSYNHTILPLATDEDVKTQIIWGLKDFENHFDRKSEGMWLPETAVNDHIMDFLIEQDIKFVILSPWQADAIAQIGTNHWQPLDNNPVPTGRAYRLERPGGSISLFFYNHMLAHGISFEHYLRNADQLYDKFLSFRHNSDKTYLINVATDGEVYGHHEPFGDMCLAAFSKLVQTNKDFQFTNYGNYLEQYPPTYLVKLKDGEAKLGTSWSCVHGVSRWYKNCGCHTGGEQGWNQEWRTPLRNAFNYLNTKLIDIYNTQMSILSSIPPVEIRNQYINVLTEQESRKEFAKRIIDKADPSNISVLNKFFCMLEGQKFSQFMFTSCGWFFSEISGLEATQNLKYAIKAIDLYRDDIKEEDILPTFLTMLETARSNISMFGTGRNIVETWILPTRKNRAFGATIFAMNKLFGNKEFKNNTYGVFKNKGIVIKNDLNAKNDVNEVFGQIIVEDFTTFKTASFEFAYVDNDLKGVSLTLKRVDRNEVTSAVLTDLPIEMRKQLRNSMSKSLIDKCITDIVNSYELTREIFSKFEEMNVQAPEGSIKLAELLVDRMFSRFFNNPALPPAEDELEIIKELLLFVKKNRLKVDLTSFKEKVSATIAFQIQELTENILEEPSRGVIHLLDTCQSLDLQPEITFAQDIVYRLLKNENRRQTIEKIEASKDFTGLNRMRRLIKLGSQLGINVDGYTEVFFSM